MRLLFSFALHIFVKVCAAIVHGRTADVQAEIKHH